MKKLLFLVLMFLSFSLFCAKKGLDEKKIRAKAKALLLGVRKMQPTNPQLAKELIIRLENQSQKEHVTEYDKVYWGYVEKEIVQFKKEEKEAKKISASYSKRFILWLQSFFRSSN